MLNVEIANQVTDKIDDKGTESLLQSNSVGLSPLSGPVGNR